ncbi:MAG: hypothetical protein PHU71_06195 [Candidatus Gracilibacteria bacterium]|nr:hypothetical protein [Candidatus Gracilibacteria bacterium]
MEKVRVGLKPHSDFEWPKFHYCVTKKQRQEAQTGFPKVLQVSGLGSLPEEITRRDDNSHVQHKGSHKGQDSFSLGLAFDAHKHKQ